MTRTERTYYLVFGLYNVSWSFLGPVYALFLLDRGLDLFQINAVLAVYLITAFVFEVPTGAVADRFGRKTSFLLSCAIRTVAFTLYYFCDSFWEFLIAEFVDAVGTTLATGALDAWAVDGMRSEGDERATDRFFARAHTLSRLLMIASGVTSGYVAEVDIALPWLLAAAGFVVSGATGALLMAEPPLRRVSTGWRAAYRSIGGTTRDGFATVRAEPVLRILCGVTLLTAFAAMPTHQLWPARMQDLGGSQLRVIGWIWALLNLAGLTGSALIARLAGVFPRESMLAVATLWRAVMLGMAALATSFHPALIGLLFQEMVFSMGEPLVLGWMNEHISAQHRATVLSVRSMSFTLGGSLGLICLGLVANTSGIPAAWLVSAFVLGVASVGYRRLGRVPPRAAAAAKAPVLSA